MGLGENTTFCWYYKENVVSKAYFSTVRQPSGHRFLMEVHGVEEQINRSRAPEQTDLAIGIQLNTNGQ